MPPGSRLNSLLLRGAASCEGERVHLGAVVGQSKMAPDPTELAFAALGAAMPDRVVHFGFLTANSSFALPWHEYCRHYPHPPEYALGYWEYESE
jgi:hypothetical protein